MAITLGQNDNTGIATFSTDGATSVNPQAMSAPNYQTTATTSNQYNGGNIVGGNTLGFYDPAPNVTQDPYAAWGGTDAYNRLVSGFDTQKQNIFGTAGDAANVGAQQLRNNILDFLDSYRLGQQNVNESNINNELAKRQGTSSILDMIGRGIRSGGTILANKNASDSSAAGEIARAYGQIGQGQLRNVGNQYEQGKTQISQDQAQLGVQANKFARDYELSKQTNVNNIVTQARDALAALDAQMAQANLPDRIAIEQEKNRIKTDALTKLSQYDQELATGRAGVTAMDPTEARRQAAERQTAGYDLGANAFNFDTTVPAQFQNTGPYASDLPVFSPQKDKRQG